MCFKANLACCVVAQNSTFFHVREALICKLSHFLLCRVPSSIPIVLTILSRFFKTESNVQGKQDHHIHTTILPYLNVTPSQYVDTYFSLTNIIE